MNAAFTNLIPIFIAFILGINAKRVIKRISLKWIDIMSTLCLYFLLLLMGMTIGFIPNVMKELSRIGINAVSIAVSSSVFIVLILKVYEITRKANKKEPRNNKKDKVKKDKINVINHIKDPLALSGCVLLGFLLGYSAHFPDINYDFFISSFLYLLIFFIALKLSFSGLNIKRIFLNKTNLFVTLLTLVSSYIGAAVISLFLPLSLVQSLAVSSGFGWYTLSGILFTKMDAPLLGSIAFLCDLCREVIALLIIPGLARMGGGSIAVGVAGATAMDVTLPVIEKHCGVSYVPMALFSGGLITLLVPFLIPFLYSFQ